uniref:Secreted protein n=1 Tax=Strigops habroptila TaxID=2489341 RepID=A0A672V0Q6_STRHB
MATHAALTSNLLLSSTTISSLVPSCSPFPTLHGAKDRADGLEVNLLVERTTAEAQVEALTVPVLYSVDHLLWHAHGEGEVPAHLPHHDGGANVLCLDLNVLARHLLGDLQAVGSVLIPTVLGAVGKGSGQLVHLCLVHFLVHTLLEALEDDGELSGGKERNRVTTRDDHLRACSHHQKQHQHGRWRSCLLSPARSVAFSSWADSC